MLSIIAVFCVRSPRFIYILVADVEKLTSYDSIKFLLGLNEKNDENFLTVPALESMP